MNDLINRGLMALLKNDEYLLAVDVNERAITHRLGMYYQLIFPEWDVDCEYNRNLSNPKSIDIDPQVFLNKMADIIEREEIFTGSNEFASRLRHDHLSIEDIDFLKSQLREPERLHYDEELDVLYFVLTLRNGNELRKLIYPDIIVHKRGTKKNHIVIEAKKSTNSDKISRAYDLVKLITLVNDHDYKYKRGYFIDIPTGTALASHSRFVFEPELMDKKVYTVKSL